MTDASDKRRAMIKLLGYLLLAGVLMYGSSMFTGGTRGVVVVRTIGDETAEIRNSVQKFFLQLCEAPGV